MRRQLAAIGLLLMSSAAVGRSAVAQETPIAHAALGSRAVSVSAGEVALEVRLIRRATKALPAAFSTPEALETVARRILDRKLLAAEARRRALDRDRQVADLLTRADDAVLADVLAQRESARVDVEDAAVDRFYNAHGDEFRSPPRRKVRHIVVASEAEAKAARAEIAAGASFDSVARTRNIDATKAGGGDLGWIARGAMVERFDEVVFSIERGTVSAPIQTAMGRHLLVVDDVDPGSLPPLPLVRDRVVAAMRQEAIDRLTDRLAAESRAVIDRDALAELLK
jgi:peptidyl-prolyl cis-trans isomerase C